MLKKKNGHSENESDVMLNELHEQEEVRKDSMIGNIKQIAYQIAGRNYGEPRALKNSLERVKSGHIVDENNNEEKKNKIRESFEQQIQERSKKLNEIQAEINDLSEVKLPCIDEDIRNCNKEIDNLKKNGIEEKSSRNKFNYLLYWIIFIPATAYLILFYVSAIHSALFRDIASEVANADQNSLSTLFNTVFDDSAYRHFHMHWFSPVIFFVFGVWLHIILESESKIKWLKCAGIIGFVLIADGLLAYYIERNNQLLRELIGMGEEGWKFYSQPGFYLVLFFGFFTSMGWSMILHKLAGEYNTARISRKIKDEISHLYVKIRQLRFEKGNLNSLLLNKLGEMKNIDSEILDLTKRKDNVHYSIVDLEKNVDDFYNGWLDYVNGLKDHSSLKSDCEHVFREFKMKYFEDPITGNIN